MRRVIEKDALSFKNQHAAFFQDPLTKIGQALEFAKSSDVLEQQFEDFLADMVYEEGAERLTYITAVETFEGIVRSSLQL